MFNDKTKVTCLPTNTVRNCFFTLRSFGLTTVGLFAMLLHEWEILTALNKWSCQQNPTKSNKNRFIVYKVQLYETTYLSSRPKMLYCPSKQISLKNHFLWLEEFKIELGCCSFYGSPTTTAKREPRLWPHVVSLSNARIFISVLGPSVPRWWIGRMKKRSNTPWLKATH